MHEAITARAFGHRARQLGEHVVARAVRHGMHGVQAQAVQVELVEPVERVVHDEGPRDLAARRVEVEGVAPRSLAVAAEERRGVPRKIVALRPEVVVDHVEKDGEPSGVTGFDERLEILRLSICGVRGERSTPSYPQPQRPGKSATGMSSTAVMPRATRWSSRSATPAKVPSRVKVPTWSS
jgi:hypothetical protein